MKTYRVAINAEGVDHQDICTAVMKVMREWLQRGGRSNTNHSSSGKKVQATLSCEVFK